MLGGNTTASWGRRTREPQHTLLQAWRGLDGQDVGDLRVEERASAGICLARRWAFRLFCGPLFFFSALGGEDLNNWGRYIGFVHRSSGFAPTSLAVCLLAPMARSGCEEDRPSRCLDHGLPCTTRGRFRGCSLSYSGVSRLPLARKQREKGMTSPRRGLGRLREEASGSVSSSGKTRRGDIQERGGSIIPGSASETMDRRTHIYCACINYPSFAE